MRNVLAVSGKQFVPTHARKQNRRLLARLAAYQIRRDDRGISRGFVHVPDQPRQQIRYVGLDNDALIFAAQICRASRVATSGSSSVVSPTRYSSGNVIV